MRNGPIRAVLAVLLLTALAACSVPRGAALQSEIVRERQRETPDYDVVHVTRASVPAIATWPATGWSGGYAWLQGGRGPSTPVIRAGDRIDLVVWDSQENSLLTGAGGKVVNMQGLTVAPDGAVFVPYVEDVVVSGQTPDQARATIQTRMAEILPAAQVLLTVEAGEGNSVDLVSGVPTPGTFPLPSRNFTILSLISQGGGISEALRNPVVRLLRDGRTYEIPSKALFASASKNIVLRGGDKVIVEADERYFTALGASGAEDLIRFDREHITALEAMSMMGGLQETRADPKGVLVLREYSAKAVRSDGTGPAMQQVVFVIDLTSADGLFAARNFRINPRDTVLVTESPVAVANTVFGLIGRLVGINNALN